MLRSRKVRQAAAAYSPDFMPIEHLWQWFREDHTCYNHESKLLAQAKAFQDVINATH